MEEKNNINIEKVKALIAEAEKTKVYDEKRISEYHDLIFGKENHRDKNKACSIMQIRKIKAWYQDQNKK